MRNKPLTRKELAIRTYEKDKVFINYEPAAPNRGAIIEYKFYQLYMAEKSVLVKIFNINAKGEPLITNIILEDGERDKVYYEVVKRLPLAALAKFKNHWNAAKVQVLNARLEHENKKTTTLLGQTRVDGVRKNGEFVEIKTDNMEGFSWDDGGGFIGAKYTQEYKVGNQKIHVDKKQKEIIDTGIFNYRNPNSLLVDKFKEAGDVNLTELATKLGFADTSMITKHLKGERDITREQAVKYANFFGCDPADILFPKPLVRIWGHVDFIRGIKMELTKNWDRPLFASPGQIYARTEDNYVECPRDIYRPDIRAVKVVSPGSYLHDQVLFYYESHNVEAHVGQLCVTGFLEVSEELDVKLKTYHIGIYENVKGKVTFANPDPYSEKKELSLKSYQSIFFTSPIIGMVNLKSMMSANTEHSSNLFREAAKVQSRVREMENRALLQQQIKFEKVQKEIEDLQKKIKEFDKNLTSAAAASKSIPELRESGFNDIFFESLKKRA